MLTEISYVLNDNVPNWPTNPKDKFETLGRIDAGDEANISSVFHHQHNGTHVDAPMHFSNEGKSLAEIPIEDFYYTSPLILTILKGRGEQITKEELEPYEKEIEKADLLCFYTGNADLRKSDPDKYVDNFPSISLEAARYLRTGFPKLKGVACDFIGVDNAERGPVTGFPVHKMMLSDIPEGDYRTLLIFEDVDTKKLLEIKDPIKAICAFPIRWENAEAAPVSIVAMS